MADTTLTQRAQNLLRIRKASSRTEESYMMWIRRFESQLPNQNDLPTESNVQAFMFRLYGDNPVSGATWNQALSALRFLYEDVLLIPFPEFKRIHREEKMKIDRFSREEMAQIIELLDQPSKLLTHLLYETGIKLLEAVRIRVNELDFQTYTLTIRDAKGYIARKIPFPQYLESMIKDQLNHARFVFEKDKREGLGKTTLPFFLLMKNAGADTQWDWQYVFPAARRTVIRNTGEEKRGFLSETVLQRDLKKALRELKIEKTNVCHVIRHTFAIEQLLSGTSIEDLKLRLGHKDIRSTQSYAIYLGKLA